MKRFWMVAVIALLVGTGLAYPVVAQPAPQQAETQDPKYACSISVPANTPTVKLAALAKLSTRQADAAASAVVAGTVIGVQLDDENGCLVYAVQINGSDGKIHDVKVDAGTGKVLHQGLGGEDEEGNSSEREGQED
jgi:uncharacterized membrane protein YkoI